VYYNLYMKLKNLSQLKIGQSAIINSFTDKIMALKLLEMGCTPGEVIKLAHIAPLGDPIAISVSGYLLSLRKEEASTILITNINGK
jgi:ferrous iron transport protein A